MKEILSNEIVCIAEFRPKVGMTEKLIRTLSELIPLTKAEPGCMRYELHQGIEDPNVITFIDRFKDQEAFDFHCKTAYTTKYFEHILPEFLQEEPKITLHREIIFK